MYLTYKNLRPTQAKILILLSQITLQSKTYKNAFVQKNWKRIFKNDIDDWWLQRQLTYTGTDFNFKGMSSLHNSKKQPGQTQKTKRAPAADPRLMLGVRLMRKPKGKPWEEQNQPTSIGHRYICHSVPFYFLEQWEFFFFFRISTFKGSSL